jgi:hypothetical protein
LWIVCAEVEIADDVAQHVLTDRRGRRRLAVSDAELEVVAALGDSQEDGVPVGVVQTRSHDLFDPLKKIVTEN